MPKVTRHRAEQQPPCPHPPHRIYAWFARDDTAPKGQVLCAACCECGAVLKGGAQLQSE